VLTDVDLAGHAETMAADPRMRPGMRELADLREVARVDIHSDTLRVLLERQALRPERYRGRHTLIVASRPAAYGLARMYQHLAEATQAIVRISVFRTMEEAEAHMAPPDAGAPPVPDAPPATPPASRSNSV
jgi:hypothetical protein